MNQDLMKYLVIIIGSFLSFNVLLAQETANLYKISQVEKGLSNYHQIKGEPTWTIEERMQHYGVPGMSVAVIQDYQIAWTKTYGFVDKEKSAPVTKNTLFQAASISKPVSAYAALSLVEDGKLDLNKNVNDYLTTWQVPENKFTKEKKVTLKHIVSHKAGLTVHGFWGYPSGQEVPTLLQLLEGESPANSDAIRVDKVPGGSMRYSGGGYCVMQQMMIDITGKTFPDLMQEKVLQPLGMTKSTFTQPLPPNQLKFAATGYLPNGSMTKGKRHTYPEMAAAGLWTNAAELAKFIIDVQQTLKGESGKVLSQEMAQKMVTPVEEDFIGLGLFLGKVDFGHSGWNEGFSSDMKAHLKNGYGVVVMLNANQPPLIREVFNAVASIYNWEWAGPPPHEKLAFSDEELNRITGKYKGELLKGIKIYESDGKVFFKRGFEDAFELVKIAENKYVRREYQAPIQFLENPENGNLALVFVPDNAEAELNYFHEKRMVDPLFWLGILALGGLIFWIYKKWEK